MNKILTYIAFIIASVVVVFLFITATTYYQLVLAVILYPALAFFAFKIFSRRNWTIAPVATHAPAIALHNGEAAASDVLDIDKRTFLKLVGATGLFFFVTSLAGKWAGSIPWGRALPGVNTSGSGSPPDVNSVQGGSLTANGYQIAEIDEGNVTFYGFTNPNGSWLIMKEDTQTNSFRYAKGNSDFPSNWAARKNLKYDYYYNLF